MNRDDTTTLRSIIVFAGTWTLYQVLRAANCDARILAAAGAIIPVTFPIVGEPSIAIGMGTHAPNSMRWGIVTEEEVAPLTEPAEAASKRACA